MNSKKRIMGKNILLVIIAVLVIISVVAAVRGGDWRPIWDKCWQWTNFFLLFTAIYWWGWPLLMKLLDGRIRVIADEIDQFEKEKVNIAAEIENIEGQLSHSEARFAQIKIKMEAEIAQRREQIISHAKSEAAAIIEQARKQRAAIIDEVREKLKAELVDMAVDNALERLPQTITAEDQKHLFENFYKNAFKKPQLA